MIIPRSRPLQRRIHGVIQALHTLTANNLGSILMARTSSQLVTQIGTTCRNVAVVLIAGICRWRSANDVNKAIKSRPVREQALITAAVLAFLFFSSAVVAQFGWIAILLFWLALILVVN